MSTPAGWYPQSDGQQRYWDGQQWTEHFAPGTVAVPTDSATPQLASQSSTKPFYKKKRFVIPGAVIALTLVAGALAPDDATTPVSASTTPGAPSSSSKSAPSPSTSTSADPAAAAADAKAKADAAAKAKADAAAKAKADAAAKIKAAADAKAKALADARAKAAALLAPYNETYGTFARITKKGRGDAIIKLPKGAAAGIVTMTHRGSSNIAASVLDSSNQPTGDLLVNEIGNYSGVTVYGLNDFGGDPTKIKITADGSWTIRIAPVSSAPVLPKSVTGVGDKVFRYDGSASDWAISHKGSSNFAVIQSGGLMPNLAVNEIGNYKGVVPLIEGPSVVTITADGRWSLVRK
ncbi:DUF2510 domain-containing protein [Phycicoccus sp. Soil802]|uniref:DUF2510 domain-containing protein n=1 Tax=Phycicoccus sp. Soil802 TaxID=1736414 RepID=UPI000703075A|nr:DUF2510 domain-containing protein [Phycicoccus sp. Soil802]KRF29497.1 hypothetical protein ASG91_00215 [Phycicoccus sp. Soil802]